MTSTGGAGGVANPVLIEVTRGPLVECLHRGALAVVSAAGETVLALGDVGRPVFPRSAIKALQALPLIETGAAARFGFGWRELALAAASHSGTDVHLDVARKMASAVSLSDQDLCCGTHEPFDSPSSRALAAAQKRPTPLHHNCSGKHLAMLATAVHLDEPLMTYWQPDHPVQRRVREVLEDVTGIELGPDVCGVDGCSVPNWAIPPQNLAMAFSRFANGSALTGERRSAVHEVMQACWANPELVAGPGRLDTVALSKLGGDVFIKTGADGAYCGTFVKRGLGFALKVDDGATRAAEAVVVALIEALVPDIKGVLPRRSLKNARGEDVGDIRPSKLLRDALEI